MIKRILAAILWQHTPVQEPNPSRSTEEWLDACYASERDEEADPGGERARRRAPMRNVGDPASRSQG